MLNFFAWDNFKGPFKVILSVYTIEWCIMIELIKNICDYGIY